MAFVAIIKVQLKVIGFTKVPISHDNKVIVEGKFTDSELSLVIK